MESVPSIERLLTGNTGGTGDNNGGNNTGGSIMPDTTLYPYYYETGNKIRALSAQGTYEDSLLFPFSFQMKTIKISQTAYNIEDTIDVLIGNRFIVQGMPCMELTMLIDLPVYMNISSGSPVKLRFNNNSGAEKYIFYSIGILTASEITDSGAGTTTWTNYYNGYEVFLQPGAKHTYTISSPGYTGSINEIRKVQTIVGSNLSNTELATINFDIITGEILSNYIETDPIYQTYLPYAREGDIILKNISVSSDKKDLSYEIWNVGTAENRISFDLKSYITSIRG